MADGVDKISEMSGLPRDALLALWESVKANQAKLDACPGHDFGEVIPVRMGAYYRCRHCDGKVDGHAVHWFNLGVAHGRASR